MTRNVLVAQSGGPTAVINSSVAGIVTEAKGNEKVDEIYGAINGILGVLNEDLVDFGLEDPAAIQQLRHTPSAALGSCRYKLGDRDYARLLEALAAHNVRYFLCAGGNDSMDTAHKLARLASAKGLELQVIGVPKTVDNDLMVTDHCPGYGSVARFNATATRDSGLDTEAIYTSDTIKIIETMGRDTGWITASTALGRDGEDSAPHLIYLPERPLIAESFLNDVKDVYNRLGKAVICVCEGLRNEKGEFLKASSKDLDTDKFGHAQLGGVGEYLANLIAKHLKIKARCDKPGTIQRVSMACASQVDLTEAYEVGRVAFSKAVNGETDKMVTIMRKREDPYESDYGLVELQEVALRTKKFPDTFINKQSNFVSDSFLKYATPLIGGPLQEYAHLRKERVKKQLPQYV
ncbi:MAG TPA: 6-phosphofructokinase [Terriglobales bacterium]|nr:6-phosphofructokinase [Terriglobales bacterium]